MADAAPSDVRGTQAALADLWRRRKPFRDSMKLLLELSDEDVELVRQATADRFDVDDIPPGITLDIDEWNFLLRAASTLYFVSRSRGASLDQMQAEFERIIADDLPPEDTQRLVRRLGSLLSADRSVEHETVTRRTAQNAGLNTVEDVSVSVDFRVQPTFPDEQLRLIPILIVRVVSWDSDEHRHRSVVLQFSDAAMETLQEELAEAVKHRDEVLEQLQKQGLA